MKKIIFTDNLKKSIKEHFCNLWNEKLQVENILKVYNGKFGDLKKNIEKHQKQIEIECSFFMVMDNGIWKYEIEEYRQKSINFSTKGKQLMVTILKEIIFWEANIIGKNNEN